MNLLLGVVFIKYQMIMADKLTSQKQLRRAMLRTAYLELEGCDPSTQGVHKEDIKTLMTQYAYGSAKVKHPDQPELWWQLLNAQPSLVAATGESMLPPTDRNPHPETHYYVYIYARC